MRQNEDTRINRAIKYFTTNRGAIEEKYVVDDTTIDFPGVDDFHEVYDLGIPTHDQIGEVSDYGEMTTEEMMAVQDEVRNVLHLNLKQHEAKLYGNAA